MSADGPGPSSHWNRHYQHESWKSGAFGVRAGLGSFVPRTVPRVVLHQALQIPFLSYGRHYKTFPYTRRAGRSIARRQGRVFDVDDLRAVLSLSCVRHHVELDPSKRHAIAVIGDGYGRISNLILETLPRTLVILVNLAPSLEMDLAAIQVVRPQAKVLAATAAQEIAHVPDDVNVMALPAEKAHLLRYVPVEGAFNTSSMQEMDYEAIRNYFDLLRSAPAADTWFYCANAVEKKWVDGTVIRFGDYPWSPEDRTLLDEICPWAHKSYQIRPPRYIDYPFRNQHRLTFLHKQA
jgi:hypothetical protein